MLIVSDNHVVLGGGGGGGGGGSTTFAGLSDKVTADIPAINTPLATALNAKEATSNKKTDVDANKTSDTFFPSVKAVFDWVSGLFVKGAASSTDNSIVLFGGTTGKLVKDCTVYVNAGNLGVGTSTPTKSLSISALVSTEFGLFSTYDYSSNRNWAFSTNSFGDNNWGGIGLWQSASHSTDPTDGIGGAVVRFGIDMSGNAGFKTSSPTADVDINGTTLRLRNVRTPASASAVGNQGDICWDENYMYVCIVANTWKRSSLATW